MKYGETLLQVGFFTERTPALERIERIEFLEEQIAIRGVQTHTDLADSAKGLVANTAKALLSRRDPAESTCLTLDAARTLSDTVLQSDELTETKKGIGDSVEVALHNLIIWGIVNQNQGRYVRMATEIEDASSMFGRREGYDIVYRTDRRKWKLQAKSSLRISNTNMYESDVVVISPDVLMRDSEGKAKDIHHYIVNDDGEKLSGMWQNLIYELRNQKADNLRGYRQVV